ncbi:MAG: hypothetical protein CMC57_06980 [Flavobacteriaceae bacterium]|nr:hypothetical protein [Flavobacteriaceae bacterium]|tara:strand:- start:3482 stop:3685 length:204 start_codon:yes stop_codon:yes gene_type:complete
MNHKRIKTFFAIILLWYIIRSINFPSFEMNFNPLTWDKNQIIKFFALVIISIAVEEFFIRKRTKKEN